MSELKPPEERGGGLIMWLLGAAAVVAVGLVVWIGSMGG